MWGLLKYFLKSNVFKFNFVTKLTPLSFLNIQTHFLFLCYVNGTVLDNLLSVPRECCVFSCVVLLAHRDGCMSCVSSGCFGSSRCLPPELLPFLWLKFCVPEFAPWLDSTKPKNTNCELWKDFPALWTSPSFNFTYFNSDRYSHGRFSRLFSHLDDYSLIYLSILDCFRKQEQHCL